jgi:hypothetical protein
VLEDLSIGGVPIARGSTVIPMKGAGSRDPAVFERPDEFDIGRADLGEAHNFGLGPHSCLGAHPRAPRGRGRRADDPRAAARHDPRRPAEFTPHLFFRVMRSLPVRRGRDAAVAPIAP